MSNVIIREFHPDLDTGLIYSTWAKGFYYGGLNIGIKPSKKQWFAAYNEYVKDQVGKADIPIACLQEDPETIIGYAIINGTCLEWVYVKELFRKQGIAKLLLKNKAIDSFNNMTKIGNALKEKLDGRTENRQTDQGIQSN